MPNLTCNECKYYNKSWGECTRNGANTPRDPDDSCPYINGYIGWWNDQGNDDDHDDYDDNDGGGCSSNGCFITTAMCFVLGYEDNCDELETLRVFRDQKMKPNAAYHAMLAEYDHTGPIIADRIYNDLDRNNLCIYLRDEYINPVVSLLKKAQDEEAVQRYRDMVYMLKERYGIS